MAVIFSLSQLFVKHCTLSRNETVTALRLRCGHIPCNGFAFLMKKSDTPNCPDCNRKDDLYHRLMECVRNEDLRKTTILFGSNQVGLCNSILAEPMSASARILYKLVNHKIYYRVARNLTEVMIRGAGHMVPADKPAASLGLISAFARGLSLDEDTAYLVTDEKNLIRKQLPEPAHH